jgi:hypothetical protein
MFTEDLSVFFADFGVPVRWGDFSTLAFYSAPGSMKDMGSGVMVATNDPEIEYETAALPGLDQGEAIAVTIDGVDAAFKVRSVTPLDDGKLSRATLKKANV